MSPHATTAPSLARFRHVVYLATVTAALVLLVASAAVAMVVGWGGLIGECR